MKKKPVYNARPDHGAHKKKTDQEKKSSTTTISSSTVINEEKTTNGKKTHIVNSTHKHTGIRSLSRSQFWTLSQHSELQYTYLGNTKEKIKYLKRILNTQLKKVHNRRADERPNEMHKSKKKRTTTKSTPT